MSGGTELVFLGIILLALAALWWSARSAITVLLAEVDDGELRVLRGAVAPRILADLRDVAKAKPRVQRATLRILRKGNRAQVEIRGAVAKDREQQFRNVVGSVPLAMLVRKASSK